MGKILKPINLVKSLFSENQAHALAIHKNFPMDIPLLDSIVLKTKKFYKMTPETRGRLGKNANNLLLSEYTADIGADIILNHFVETESVIS